MGRFKRWWLCWLGLAVFGLMLFLGLADTGWHTMDCQGVEPQAMLLGIAAPGALVTAAFGLLWAYLYRNLSSQPMRAFGLILALLGGGVGMLLPVVALIEVAETTVVSA